MVVVDLHVMEVAGGDLYNEFVVLVGCFVVFCQLTEVYMGVREGKSFHS